MPRSSFRTFFFFRTPWGWAFTSPRARARASSGRCATKSQCARSPHPIRRSSSATCSTRCASCGARAVTDYLNAQIEAGVQAVMLFDTWGGTLAHADYETFSLAYSRRVLAGLAKMREGRRVPSILYTKGGGAWLEAMAASGCDAIGLDAATDPASARRAAAGRVALQGNLDSAALLAPPEQVRAAGRRVLDAFGGAPGHVFNLGHGVLPRTPVESVAALVDEVRAYSRMLRSS